MAHRETPDVLVILGCRVGPGAQVRGALARRVDRGARTALDLGVPTIVVSGGRRWGGVREADAMRAALVDKGVPAGRILTETESLSTWQNAHRTAVLVRQLGSKRVGVVTCDWHMDRALSCFAVAGVVATPVPATSPPVGPVAAAMRRVLERARWWTAAATRGATCGR